SRTTARTRSPRPTRPRSRWRSRSRTRSRPRSTRTLRAPLPTRWSKRRSRNRSTMTPEQHERARTLHRLYHGIRECGRAHLTPNAAKVDDPESLAKLFEACDVLLAPRPGDGGAMSAHHPWTPTLQDLLNDLKAEFPELVKTSEQAHRERAAELEA